MKASRLWPKSPACHQQNHRCHDDRSRCVRRPVDARHRPQAHRRHHTGNHKTSRAPKTRHAHGNGRAEPCKQEHIPRRRQPDIKPRPHQQSSACPHSHCHSRRSQNREDPRIPSSKTAEKKRQKNSRQYLQTEQQSERQRHTARWPNRRKHRVGVSKKLRRSHGRQINRRRDSRVGQNEFACLPQWGNGRHAGLVNLPTSLLQILFVPHRSLRHVQQPRLPTPSKTSFTPPFRSHDEPESGDQSRVGRAPRDAIHSKICVASYQKNQISSPGRGGTSGTLAK